MTWLERRSVRLRLEAENKRLQRHNVELAQQLDERDKADHLEGKKGAAKIRELELALTGLSAHLQEQRELNASLNRKLLALRHQADSNQALMDAVREAANRFPQKRIVTVGSMTNTRGELIGLPAVTPETVSINDAVIDPERYM